MFGPHTENAREVRDAVVTSGLGVEVAGGAALVDGFVGFVATPKPPKGKKK